MLVCNIIDKIFLKKPPFQKKKITLRRAIFSTYVQ
jgi:hypothetical protein